MRGDDTVASKRVIVRRRRRWAGRHLHIVECGVKGLQQKEGPQDIEHVTLVL